MNMPTNNSDSKIIRKTHIQNSDLKIVLSPCPMYKEDMDIKRKCKINKFILIFRVLFYRID